MCYTIDTTRRLRGLVVSEIHKRSSKTDLVVTAKSGARVSPGHMILLRSHQIFSELSRPAQCCCPFCTTSRLIFRSCSKFPPILDRFWEFSKQQSLRFHRDFLTLKPNHNPLPGTARTGSVSLGNFPEILSPRLNRDANGPLKIYGSRVNPITRGRTTKLYIHKEKFN